MKNICWKNIYWEPDIIQASIVVGVRNRIVNNIDTASDLKYITALATLVFKWLRIYVFHIIDYVVLESAAYKENLCI